MDGLGGRVVLGCREEFEIDGGATRLGVEAVAEKAVVVKVFQAMADVANEFNLSRVRDV